MSKTTDALHTLDFSGPQLANYADTQHQADIAAFLHLRFDDVSEQYSLGGYFALKIDFDIGNGKIGVELKMAESLRNPGETQRLIGQAIYYRQRRYGDNLIVGVVGAEEVLRGPAVRETLSFLTELGIGCIPILTI